MRSIILYGLFIGLLCSISTRLIKATSVEDSYDEDYNYDEYDEYDENSQAPRGQDYGIGAIVSDVSKNKGRAQNATEEAITLKTEEIHENTTESVQKEVITRITDKTESVHGGVIEEMEILQSDICPKWCTCDEQFQFIDCSNHSLSEIPKHFPNTSLHIKLSDNNIEEIQENAFSNLTELRQIILTSNKIQNIHKNAFQTLDRLDHLELSSNNISKIHPDLFLYSQGLSQLNLNYNPIAFEANKTFLNLPNLEILNLVGCNITQLYDETFINLTGLIDLNLSNNSFTEDIYVDAFKPIQDLRKLKIPHVSRTATYVLCEKLAVIDVISFDNYNISCYELVSGSSYDESTITHGPPTTAHVETTTAAIRPRIQQSSTTEETVVTTESPKTNVTEITDLSQKTSDATIDALNTTNHEFVDTKKLEKSTQSIKTILIASIVIAVIGLIIGLICRKDIFGVKTKLCRTQRQEPVTIPEQVPLNKV